jgi:hypothetical protein
VDPALGWSQGLSVEVGGAGTVAQAGIVLPRLLADRVGLTTGLSGALATSWGQRERTMPYRVIQGDQTFADHARGGQGILWRYSSCTFLAAAVAAIDALPVAAVRREFSVAEMVDLGVYKAQPNEDDDTAFDRVLENLRRLGRHYHQFVGKGLDVIVERD